MMKFEKKTPLSLSLSTCRSVDHFDFPERMCMYQSLSLSLSIYICKNGLDPDQRNSGNNVSSIKKMCSCAIESTQSVVQKPMRTIKWVLSVYIVRSHARIQRRGFLINTGTDPLKFSKLPSQHSTLGHHQHASKTLFKGVSLAGR